MTSVANTRAVGRHSSHVLLPRYDASSPETIADPYAVYERLRAQGPLCRGGPGQWVVTHHAQVTAALRDPRLGHEFPAAFHQFALGDGRASTFFQRVLLYRDPPEHTRLRDAMRAGFAGTMMKRLTGRISELVDELLALVAERGSMDAIDDLAAPLPLFVVCELLGIPATERELVRPHATVLTRAFGTQVAAANRQEVDDAVAWLRAYVGQAIAERQRRPAQDLLTVFAEAASRSEEVYDELIDNAVFLLFAGFETTTNLIGNGFAALVRFPGELRRLLGDRSLVESAVEEFLRFDAPIQGVARMVRQPIEIAGREIREHRVLVLLLGSANHDARTFDAPERLDIGRSPNPHVAFGGGIHGCFGAALARAEATIAFSRLLERFAVIEQHGDVVRRRNTSMSAHEHVPLRVVPR